MTNRIRTAISALAIAAGTIVALPAAAQMVRAQDPQSVLAAMKAGGYSDATLGKDGEGDPKISAKIDGTTFHVYFYNCTGNKACATVQFHAGYDLKKPIKLERINEWNRTHRFGRAYVDDEGDPILQMDLDLDDGGVSRLLFIDNLEFWSTVVSKFEQHIGF
ncbi:MAG: YbjN domain-containing protein [Zymomonas sp.]|nr:MAG: YbjN domain-containing protein [Zymomonas sp.]